MRTAKAKKNGRQRINVVLPAALSNQLDTYCIKLMNHKGFINDVKPKVIRTALEEWLRNHVEDFDIKF